MNQLTEPEIYQFITQYESRDYTDDGMLVATYEFEDFLEAVSFVNDLAEIVESMDHHPALDIRYNAVTVATCTHDEDDAITDKDIGLVEAIEELIE